MASWLPRGLGGRMAGIVGLCLLPTAALAGYTAWVDRQHAWRESWNEAQRVARLSAAHHAMPWPAAFRKSLRENAIPAAPRRLCGCWHIAASFSIGAGARRYLAFRYTTS